MDHALRPPDGGSLPLQGPHWHRSFPGELPPDFAPLRLVLQPSGQSFELTRPEIILGRHSEADVRLPMPDVSRRHCRLVFKDGQWQVFDLQSLNGTFVNSQRVQQTVLQHQDVLRVGGFTFEVQVRSSHPTVAVPTRSAEAGVLYRIVEALPPDDQRPIRRAS